MEKGTERKTEPRGAGRGWSEGRMEYISADGVDIRIASRVFRLQRLNDHSGNSNQTVPVNTVMYCARESPTASLFVSATEFARNMSQIVRGAVDIKTIIFPSTVRETSEDAFSHTSVRSVVLNEGLETIG